MLNVASHICIISDHSLTTTTAYIHSTLHSAPAHCTLHSAFCINHTLLVRAFAALALGISLSTQYPCLCKALQDYVCVCV